MGLVRGGGKDGEEHQGGGRAAAMMENTRKSKRFGEDRMDSREHHEDH